MYCNCSRQCLEIIPATPKIYVSAGDSLPIVANDSISLRPQGDGLSPDERATLGKFSLPRPRPKELARQFIVARKTHSGKQSGLQSTSSRCTVGLLSTEGVGMDWWIKAFGMGRAERTQEMA